MSERTSVRIPKRITLTTPYHTEKCTPKAHTSSAVVNAAPPAPKRPRPVTTVLTPKVTG